jgi:hypothetical protein
MPLYFDLLSMNRKPGTCSSIVYRASPPVVDIGLQIVGSMWVPLVRTLSDLGLLCLYYLHGPIRVANFKLVTVEL